MPPFLENEPSLATLKRNMWQLCPGLSGNFKSEEVATFVRNPHEPLFSENSYGFRPNRNQEQAIRAAQEIVQNGKAWVVDMDLSKFFDTINHDRLLNRIGQQVTDKRVLRLIGLALRSGIMSKEGLLTTTEGTTQGSPLSPLLSNIVLDELDKELEKRGLAFCRFADDCNIFTRTEQAANRVRISITQFIEKKLKLKVNEEKTKVALSKFVKFLGMTILGLNICVSAKSMSRAMEKVKELTPRGTHLPLEKTMEQINSWYEGWANYHKMTSYPDQLLKIEAHIRRRLRARIIKQQKRRRTLRKKLEAQGVSPELARRTAGSNKSTWALSITRALHLAFPNKWFIERYGQYVMSDKKLEHWLDIKQKPILS